MADLVVRGGTVVTAERTWVADVAIERGVFTEVAPELTTAGSTEIDARGLFVFPGVIDVHLHFNEPGRTEWEGAATGSRALAAGGGTLFVDMPLNSTPCTVNAREFDRKRAALEAVSITDFAIWGGLIPGSVGEMPELASRGVAGFKAFMSDSGLPEFPRSDDCTLMEGMREAGRLGLPLAVHAESEEITRGLARRLAAEGRSGVRAFLDSRPVVAESEAIQRAALLAGETGAKLHIVHVSSGRGVAIAAEARARGVDISIETCPHYLWFTEDDVERLGAAAKCAPPLRTVREQSALWEALLNGDVDMVASDHSPSPPEMKTGDFLRAWGGIAGVQSTLPVLVEAGHFERRLKLEQIARLTAAEPARRFEFGGKGSIAVGNDADFVLVQLGVPCELRRQDLFQRHRLSPYIGERFRASVRRTVRRGETLFMNGMISAVTRGKFVRPRTI